MTRRIPLALMFRLTLGLTSLQRSTNVAPLLLDLFPQIDAVYPQVQDLIA